MASIAVVPAAGRGRRFGDAPKLRALVDGVPMLARTVRSLLDAGVDRVVVVVAPDASVDGIDTLSDARVAVVTNADPSRGMFSSVQTGIHAGQRPRAKGQGSDGFQGQRPMAEGQSPEEFQCALVLPGDMPFVRPDTIRSVIDTCLRTATVVSPAFDGSRGHPVALPAAVVALISEAEAASVLSDLLAASGVARTELPVDDPGVLRDVDVPGDL